MKKLNAIRLVAAAVLVASASTAAVAGVSSGSEDSDVKCAGYVALTFDDGPNPDSTAKIVKELADNHAHATFFNTGANEERYPDLVKLEQRNGNQFGNHSYDHPDLTTLSPQLVEKNLLGTNQIHLKLTGSAPKFFRPPFDRTNTTVEMNREQLGLTEVLWTVDTDDYKDDSTTKSIVDSALTAESGGIVLMHDGGIKKTYKAVPKIISGLRAKNLCTGSLAVSDGRVVVTK